MKTYLLPVEVDQEDDGRWNAAPARGAGCKPPQTAA
jgi:hypothetical protein